MTAPYAPENPAITEMVMVLSVTPTAGAEGPDAAPAAPALATLVGVLRPVPVPAPATVLAVTAPAFAGVAAAVAPPVASPPGAGWPVPRVVLVSTVDTAPAPPCWARGVAPFRGALTEQPAAVAAARAAQP